MAEPTIVDWLRGEVAKRLAPFTVVSPKGVEMEHPPLCTCITLLPTQAMELLTFIEKNQEQDDGQA